MRRLRLSVLAQSAGQFRVRDLCDHEHIADLKSKGVAIVYISHRLEELIRIGDFITVLRDGRVTGAKRMAEVDLQWIVRQMIGSDAKDFSTPGKHDFGREALRAVNVSLTRITGGYAVDHVS